MLPQFFFPVRSSIINQGSARFATASNENFHFPGADTVFSSTLDWNPEIPILPTYRVLDHDGSVIDPSEMPNEITDEKMVDVYKQMLTLRAMDDTLYQSQRMGHISFYMTSYGEEPSHFGSAMALDPSDMVYGQYREAGVLLYRGFTLDQFADQCVSNHQEIGRGKQMPVHYGSKDLNFQIISSPLSTQIPHASGAGYGYTLEGADRLAITYFGEGAASEGDFHTALNFASTLDSSTLFFCRNNGWAISTPAFDQYRGDGIASRAHGYGMKSIRVDGTDLFAVYNATKKAREYIIKERRPVLIEAMSYRAGHHSTSDDSTLYRSSDEISFWKDAHDPIKKFLSFLDKKSLFNAKESTEFYDHQVQSIREALTKALAIPWASPLDMFTEVYDEMTPRLLEQQNDLRHHLKKHGRHYNLEKYLPVEEGFVFEDEMETSEDDYSSYDDA